MVAGTALTGKTGANCFLEYLGAAEIGTPKIVVSRFSPITWTFGTGANQINVLFQDQRSTDDTGETLDLNSGATLKDSFGNVLTMENLKFLYIKNTHASLVLELFGNTSLDLLIITGTTDAIEIPPGGEFYWSAPTALGIDVSTNVKLYIACVTAATITYDIIVGMRRYDEEIRGLLNQITSNKPLREAFSEARGDNFSDYDKDIEKFFKIIARQME